MKRGQSLVEFALVIVIFVALLVGLVIFSLVFYTYVTLGHMARAGVSYMMDNALTLAEWNQQNPNQPDKPLKDYIKSLAGFLNTTEPYPMKIEISPPPNMRMPGGYFEVKVSYHFNLLSLSLPNPLSGREIQVIRPIWISAAAGSFYE
ncbi:MAG: pilus assembly protein [Anaerolineae bacterium]|nr:pilus assembly protein [Anaerolineae bacterium]MDW8101721.1 pilus assembly protein [Anaerolineae bacterium]